MCDYLPTLYQYYTANSIRSGLTADGTTFKLNNRDITIYSGAMHYFRVPQEYWRDRLQKLKAAGLNAVETYVPWNLHEPEPGVFDFGTGGSDWERLLDIEKFLKIAKEEDLFAIVRPGPYICAEWEFGGLPSWLLREKDIKVRTSDSKFMKHVIRYFGVLLKIMSVLQFTKGGPIIAFQIENEYGNAKPSDSDVVDKGYMEQLKQLFEKNNITELLFTSDTPLISFAGSLPGVLYTANLQNNAKKELEFLKKHQPNRPLMVMEYWTGWFDHWAEHHHMYSVKSFTDTLKTILDMNSSVNFYMFHGGSNFGFMNGGNLKKSNSTNNEGYQYQPTVSSYDYDAPLNEHGNYTEKYHSLKKMIAESNKVKTCVPKLPKIVPLVKYDTITISKQLVYLEIIKRIPYNLQSTNLIPMELLDINNGAGQSYGYIIYRKNNIDIPSNSVLTIEGHVSDTVMILINGVLISKLLENSNDLDGFGYWRMANSTFQFGGQDYKNVTLDLIVENWGRVNFGMLSQYNQFKGLWQGNVLLNDKILADFNILPLEFRRFWTNSLSGWSDTIRYEKGPSFYMAELNINNTVNDTYIDMRNWNKGIVILNGFVLSRYCKLGPQLSVYVPAPFLKHGRNEIIIFEHFETGKTISFSDKPILI